MADIHMNQIDLNINLGSNDYVLNYLNFADFELANSDNKSTDSLFERRNMVHKSPLKYFNNCLQEPSESVDNSQRDKNFLSDHESSDKCLKMGVEMTNMSTTVHNSGDMRRESDDMFLDMTMGCNNESNNSLSDISKVKSAKIQERKQIPESMSYSRKYKKSKTLKYLKRNCDLGVDTRADPDLKPSANNFVRTRGKPISKKKQKMICYKMSEAKKFCSMSTDKSSHNSIYGSKQSKKLNSDDSSSNSSMSHNRKNQNIDLNIADSLKTGDNTTNNLLLTFLSMKIYSEHQFKGYYNNLHDLENFTKRIESLKFDSKQHKHCQRSKTN